jgi:hypothetical protein
LLHDFFSLLRGIYISHLVIEPADNGTKKFEDIGNIFEFIVALVVEYYSDESADGLEVEDKFVYLYFLIGEDGLDE